MKPSHLLRSREICSNLPEEVHQIAEAIAKKAEQDWYMSPQELALMFSTVLEENLIAHFELFPQLVDKLEQCYANGEEYANVFRKICQVVIGINPPFIVETKEYPENIKVAVEWWTNAVLFRKDISNMPVDFQKIFRRQYTDEAVALFKSTLAREIERQFADGKTQVYIASEWTADEILEHAGNKIGVNPYLGYPDAAMAIYKNEVKVSVDGGHTWKQIFYVE